MRYFQIIIIICCFFVSACATRPISNYEAVITPNDRILNDQYSKPSSNTGTVIIKRDKGFGGSACSTRIFVNGEPVADIRTSEKIVLYLPESEYVLSAWPNSICGGGMSEVTAYVKVDEQLSYRVGYGSNGDFFINRTAF
jgi:hypothetical protein